MFTDFVRDGNLRVYLQVLVRSEDTGAEDGVVPVKYDTCLAKLRLILRLEPDLLLRESCKHLRSQ